ncbi:MAG: putative DNA binding domain-containing protein [Betaproteobacteria bacterium]|nr:putative DNA binding domain-containing protein [Betaproteobacteria bacterium]
MTADELRGLIAKGETLDVEFKGEEKQQLSDGELVEAAVCLANREGVAPGFLLVGVEDDGRITGHRPRHGPATDPQAVMALIANRTRPSLGCRVELVAVDGRVVLVIQIAPSRLPVGTTEGKFVRRAMGGRGEPICAPLHFSEMQGLMAAKGAQDYSALVFDGTAWNDLDPLEFERFRRFVRESRGTGDIALLNLSDEELARALGAVDETDGAVRVRVGGLLLFGKEESIRRYLPTHEVAFQVLMRSRVEVNQFYRWPLLRVMEELLTQFRARSREKELMVGMLRVGIPDYPEPAFREAVANALIHRDYTRLGAVHVQWHEDRLEVSNPGGFPEGVRVDNILVTAPRPRNPLLADAFKRAGIVERTGRGVDTIFFEQLRNGRPAPSYDRSSPTDVVLALPGGEANLEFVRLAVEEAQAGRDLSLSDLLLLNALQVERSLDTPHAAALLQRPEAEARASLQRLAEAGLVEGRGERKGRAYHLSGATYRRLGDKAGYVRQRGFEPYQQEQMILQYVAEHGRITRKETADLCKLAPSQARNLLIRMKKANQLSLKGARRGAFYVLPPK